MYIYTFKIHSGMSQNIKTFGITVTREGRIGQDRTEQGRVE